MGFKVGYWYRWKYEKDTEWEKCISVDILGSAIFEKTGLWIDYSNFIESKYHPDLKKKLRKILE